MLAADPLRAFGAMKPQHFLALAFAQVLWGANFAVLKLGLETWPVLFFVGSLHGAEGLATAWLVGLPLLLTLNLRRARIVFGFSIGSVLKALAPPIVLSLAVAGVIGAAAIALGALAKTVTGVAALCLVAAIAYLAMLWFFDRSSALTLLGLVIRRPRMATANV